MNVWCRKYFINEHNGNSITSQISSPIVEYVRTNFITKCIIFLIKYGDKNMLSPKTNVIFDELNFINKC